MIKPTAVLVFAMSLTLAPAAAAKSNPENDKLPPTANAGYFLGYPSPTYSWHGCTKTATARTASSTPIAGEPDLIKGSKQKAVTFTIRTTAPYVSWQVKDGWRICGVQVSAVLNNDNVSSMLLAEAGYTSGPKKGSTSKSGTETIQVTIPTKGIGSAGFEEFEGQTFSMRSIRQVAVFVRKAN